jgi:hypothetical protein
LRQLGRSKGSGWKSFKGAAAPGKRPRMRPEAGSSIASTLLFQVRLPPLRPIPLRHGTAPPVQDHQAGAGKPSCLPLPTTANCRISVWRGTGARRCVTGFSLQQVAEEFAPIHGTGIGGTTRIRAAAVSSKWTVSSTISLWIGTQGVNLPHSSRYRLRRHQEECCIGGLCDAFMVCKAEAGVPAPAVRWLASAEHHFRTHRPACGC